MKKQNTRRRVSLSILLPNLFVFLFVTDVWENKKTTPSELNIEMCSSSITN